MMMLSVSGLILVSLCVTLLLSGRLSPLITLSLTPILVAFVAGFSPTEVSGFFSSGLRTVTPVAVMFIFSILYFALMQERRLFDPLINQVITRAQGSLTSVAMGTVIIASVAHLDGSGASTFLICIPALLPVYRRLEMSPYLLLLLVSMSASVMNMLPWGGPLGRAAGVIGSDAALLWRALIPVQGSALLLLLIGAYMLGRRELRRREARRAEVINATQHVVNSSDLSHSSHSSNSSQSRDPSSPAENTQPVALDAQWWTNAALTASVIALLLSGALPSALVFMIALSLGLLVNRLDREAQQDFIKRHAWSALQMAGIIFAAGVFLGVLRESQMLSALARDLMGLLPDLLHTNLHIAVGIFGAPLELLFNTDAYYFALLPLVIETVQPHGVSGEAVVYALLIGNIIGTFISPFSPALWLGLGLAQLEMGRHIRYALAWVWGLSVALLGVAWLLGLF